MTRAERVEAFEMRLRGMTWREIAESLHYDRKTVERDMKACVNGRRQRCHCTYPALREIIVRDYNGSLNRFAAASGIPYASLYSCLTGRSRPAKTGHRICAFLGMTPEEAFGKREFL